MYIVSILNILFLRYHTLEARQESSLEFVRSSVRSFTGSGRFILLSAQITFDFADASSVTVRVEPLSHCTAVLTWFDDYGSTESTQGEREGDRMQCAVQSYWICIRVLLYVRFGRRSQQVNIASAKQLLLVYKVAAKDQKSKSATCFYLFRSLSTH